MKKVFIGGALAALLLLSACQTPPDPADSGSAAGSVSGSDASGDEAMVPAYFGDWEVVSSPGTTPACAMTQEEVDACIGLAVSYGADQFTAEGLRCEFLPGTAYAEGILSAEEFSAACGLELSQLGVSASMLLHVTVDIQGSAGQNRLLGRDFFVLGSDSLLIYCDGAFFLAQRAE